MTMIDEDENIVPEMTLEEREAAIQAWKNKGGKIKVCPPKVAADTIWLGGRLGGVEVTGSPKNDEDEDA